MNRFDHYDYDIKDIDLETFVKAYSLMLFEASAIKMGLLLCCGNTLQGAKILACNNNREEYLAAVTDLLRVGFLKVREV
jgi:hypothetical protein